MDRQKRTLTVRYHFEDKIGDLKLVHVMSEDTLSFDYNTTA